MLTQRPAPDPKCELNVTSFLTLTHPLHCPSCAKDIMVTVLLLQVMWVWEGWGGLFMLGLGWGDRGWVSIFFNYWFCFCTVVNCSLTVGAYFVVSVSLFLFCFVSGFSN